MSAQPNSKLLISGKSKRRKSPAPKRSLQTILYRLDNGEITVEIAYDQVQEADREHRSTFNRFLEFIAG
jgi:hypothetical protein